MSFTIRIEAKEPDQFSELINALPHGEYSKWFQHGEYATIELLCEVRNGRPVIVKAKFLRMRR